MIIYIGVVNGIKKILKLTFFQMFLTNICFHDVFSKKIFIKMRFEMILFEIFILFMTFIIS
jgi:hypothetical protein